MAAVALIVEVVEGHRFVGLGGIEVGRHACLEAQGAALAEVHSELNGALRHVVFPDGIEFARPSGGTVCRLLSRSFIDGTRGRGQGIGHIGKAIVGPVAPTVHNNPGSVLVLPICIERFASGAIIVEVHLNTVVPSHTNHSMVHLRAGHPVVFSGEAVSIVGGRLGNGKQFGASGSTAKPNDATRAERLVAIVVIKIALPGLHALFGHTPQRKARVVLDAVKHGLVPIFVALHPACIVSLDFIHAIFVAIGEAAIGFGIGVSHEHGHFLLFSSVIRERILKVGGQMVFGERSIGAAIGIELQVEHVAHSRSHSTRASGLVEHWRKVDSFGVVPTLGQRFAAIFLAGRTLG